MPWAGRIDDLHGTPAAQEVILGLGHQIGQGYRLSAGGRLEGHLLVVFGGVLEVVNTGQRLGHPGHLGVGRDVFHTLPFQPHLKAVSQTLQELSAGPYRRM